MLLSRGVSDLSVKAGIGYDDERFYLTVVVDDDHHVQRFPAEEAWRGDGIQFGIARDADNCYEFVLTKAASGVHVACTQRPIATNAESLIAASTFTVTQDGATTIYRCVIPWRMIPPMSPKDDSVHVSLLVNENDGEGRCGWIAWADGIGEAKNVERYQPIIFLPGK